MIFTRRFRRCIFFCFLVEFSVLVRNSFLFFALHAALQLYPRKTPSDLLYKINLVKIIPFQNKTKNTPLTIDKYLLWNKIFDNFAQIVDTSQTSCSVKNFS